jgi:hypothetical protein
VCGQQGHHLLPLLVLLARLLQLQPLLLLVVADLTPA